MNISVPDRKLVLISAARFLGIFTVSMLVATSINYDTYKDFYSRRLFKLHTSDLAALASQMTVKLNFFLSQGNGEGVQSVLDASFGLFGYVVTDCRRVTQLCPEQKILFTSDPSLPWAHPPHSHDFSSSSFVPLRRLPGINRENDPADPGPTQPGQVIGRLYVINNIPHSFSEEFLATIKAPFSDVGARRFYLRNTLSFFSGALIIWVIAEFSFMFRRKQLLALQLRESELKEAVNRQMKQLALKDAQVTRLNQESDRHYEAYVEKIRSLNDKMQSEEEYREFAEQIISEMERDKAAETEKYTEELSQVRQDMERLQKKVEQFQKSSAAKTESSYRALEEAVRTPHFSNVFEQTIFDSITSCAQYKNGEWQVLRNYDVAPGRNYRQFTDFILFNKDALIILEAKYYVGRIDSPGDFLNDIWISAGTQKKRIDCLWGENPYHQLNEYSMSLMKILKQKSPWNFQIFGVIIFPDEADISKVGEHLGKFYRVATLSKSRALFEAIFAEAARFQAAKNPIRPKTEQVEAMLRGRKISA